MTIHYEYDYGRLVGISYPDHPESNVKYRYGGINSSYNRIGRLMLREDGITIDYKTKYVKQQQQPIKDSYKDFSVAYNGEDNDDDVNGDGFCCNDKSLEAVLERAMVAQSAKTRAVDDNFHDKDKYERLQFYYHPDHLGSSSYITNLDGEVTQHIEYLPFGEVFVEERNKTWNTPYLFNAKESIYNG